MIITAGGENVAPTPIEQALLELLGPAVAGHAVLIGDQRKFLSCLVAPPEGKSGAIDEAVLVKAVTEYNENFAKSRAQRIQKITSLIEPFGEQTGELTPTMKVKRKNVIGKYADVVESMYVGAPLAGYQSVTF